MLGILCVTCVQDDFLNNGVSIDTVLKHTCVPVALRRRFGRGGERKDTLDTCTGTLTCTTSLQVLPSKSLALALALTTGNIHVPHTHCVCTTCMYVYTYTCTTMCEMLLSSLHLLILTFYCSTHKNLVVCCLKNVSHVPHTHVAHRHTDFLSV